MSIRGVLFDFSGTLFHLEPSAEWFDGYALDRARMIDVLTSPASSGYLPEDLRDAWERRDLDPDIHHTVYLTALRAAAPGVPGEVLESIYRRVPAAESWLPYPDTGAALSRLRDAGVPVAVISNIPWDIRGVFDRNGMADLVDEYVLSYAEGVMKPDPKIFLTACERIGVEPKHAMMIGDNEEADGGARRIGCRFAAVKRVPPAQRPDALVRTLARTIFV
ncbi:MAG TPA: HAD family hydrolase [Actinophytocola sp.]|uniref:HAD family hydrolase n=1 Tax=Actinophytocola sp. TaxID=1872138 RepID=UPI002DDCDCE8|nr:HAD family hydrolase [Actinophytocola sp.]HEV2783253.1 HAD family hydrolase [Actinophytocola sp.]